MKTKTSSKGAISPFTIVGGLLALLLGLILIFNTPINFPPLEGFYHDDSDDVVIVTTEAFQSDFGRMVITSRTELELLNKAYNANNGVTLSFPVFLKHVLGDYVGNAPESVDPEHLADWSGYIRQATADIAKKYHEITKGGGDIVAPLALNNIVGREVARLLDSFDDGQVPEEIRPQLVGLQKVMQEVIEYWDAEKAGGQVEEE